MIKRMALLACLVSQGFAITGGPNMPEYVQFEEVSANNLVDPNTGNFTYVVPLLEVPGPGGTYPLALSYHSGIRYNQEASWVGLGWSLNAGAINRVLRGVPDDYFNSMVATRNVQNKSGSTIGVNMGIGPMGLAMSWDANTGKFLGGSPYVGLSTAMIPGIGSFANIASIGVTLSPGGVSVALGGNLQVGTVSLGLYNSSDNSAGGGLSFSPGYHGSVEYSKNKNLSVGASAFHTSGSSIGSSAGEGDMTYATNGVNVSVGYFHIGVNQTDWRYSLDEAVVDYMNGFLFQDGIGTGFINRMPEATAFKAGTIVPQPPRKRFERSKFGSALMPSGDLYTVSANGLGGSFQPFLAPGAPVPIVLDDAGGNNEGYKIENAPSIYNIQFRMEGDKGYNLLHDQAAVAGQLPPDGFSHDYGNATTMAQYGSHRIMPVFQKPSGSTAYKNILTGFIIRNPDGMTYEYRQPVYSILQADYAFPDPTEATEANRMSKVNADKYANAWLLTAVKGADYVPANSASISPVAGDYGHWVRFDYTSPNLVNWSAPHTGNAPPESKAAGGYYTRAYGIREQTFLQAIETQTHKAVFETVNRLDVPISKNNPTNNAPGSTTGMKHDDGWLSPRFEEGRYTWQNKTAGGYPIQITDPNATVGNFDSPTSAFFTMVFPGNWGAAIRNYRNVNCNSNECTANAEGLEKFFGLHLKFTFNSIPPCPGGGCQTDPVAANEDVFVGKNIIDEPYDGKHYGFYADMHCPWMEVNAEGDTRVQCNVTLSSHVPGKSVADWVNFRVYSGFLNWPELEKVGILNYSGRPQALNAIKLFNKTQPSRVTKEIRFGYDYSLCNKLPDHPGDAAGNTGKLTLKKLSVYGDGGFAAGASVKMPDYNFGYQSGSANPDYSGPYKQDIWGMYSPGGSQVTRLTRQVNTGSTPPNGGEMVGVAWNLNRIELPTGGRIEVDYKRDEYYFAGLAKDVVTGKYIAFPDVFALEIQKTSSRTVDWSKYYKLTKNEIFEPYSLNLRDNNPTATSSNLPKKTQTDYAITASGTSPIEPQNGELALVAFVMERSLSGDAFSTMFTGIMNVVVVNRVGTSTPIRVSLHPLLQKDENNRFFYYSNFDNANSGSFAKYKFTYYLIPIRNPERRFFGGDVAVKTVKLYDGLGSQPLTKKYETFADKIRDAQGAWIQDTPFALSSGATWTMPEMPDDEKYKKHYTILSDPKTNLNFDPWPYWCFYNGAIGPGSSCNFSDAVSPPTAPTKNILTTFLNNAFDPQTLPGGYYYPGAGVTYGRSRESSVDAQGASPGYEEYQFYNLAHNFLNNALKHDAAAPVRNYEINDWISSGGVITAKLAAMSSKMMRKYQVSNADAIVQKNELDYATDVTVYKCAAVSQACPTPIETVPLGAVQQRTGWRFGAGTNQFLSVRVPAAHAVKDISVIDGVRNEVNTLAFDSKSGVAIASSKTNSDGKGLASYSIPLHWSSDPARSANRLNLYSEERTYAMPAGTTFDRSALSRIINSKIKVWSTLPIRRMFNFQATSTFLYDSKSYQWSSPLGSDGLPTTAYALPDQNFAYPWMPTGPKVTQLNEYSYPIETQHPITGTYSASYTGHNTNLITAVVQNAKWKEATILTCDFMHPENSQYFDAMTGWRKGVGGAVSLEPSSEDVGANVIKLVNTGSIYTNYITIDPAKRRKYRASIRAKCQTGTLTLKLAPNVGPAVTLEFSDTWYRNVEQTIDLALGDYIGATSLYVEVKSSSGGTGYVQEVRVHPDDALASSFFYDPVTYKLIGTLDENGQSRKFTYDALGRLTSKINHWGAVTETYQYKNMVNPQ